MNNEKYNGWTNYATWKVALEILDGLTANDLFGCKCEADDLKSYCEELVYEGCSEGSFAHSCVTSTLSEVNWYELAEHLNED